MKSKNRIHVNVQKKKVVDVEKKRKMRKKSKVSQKVK